MTSRQETGISPITEVIADIKAGRMAVLVDEADRENEGDLLIAAEFVTPEAINFMARYGRGLICLTLTAERCRQLNLPQMVANNRSPLGTSFTVSIEAAEGVTTGISAADRARTVQVAMRPDASPSDLVQPGHIFPLMAHEGGVLARAGHTEAGCDLARLAGLAPAAVICEILKDNGEMARLPGYGFLVPTGTPREAITRLNAESLKAMTFPEVKERMAATGLTPLGSTPEEFGALIRSEVEKWGKVVKATGMRVD